MTEETIEEMTEEKTDKTEEMIEITKMVDNKKQEEVINNDPEYH